MRIRWIIAVLILSSGSLRAQIQDSSYWAGIVDSTGRQSAELLKKNRFQEAFSPANLAVQIAEEHLGHSNNLTANAIANLGNCYRYLEKYDSAAIEMERAIAIKKQILGEEHMETIALLVDLGWVDRNNYQLQKAESELLYSKATLEKNDQTKQRTYLRCLVNLAEVYTASGSFEQAEASYLEVLKIKEAQYGKESATYGASLNDLGNVYWLSGRMEEASTAYKTALVIFLNKLGKDDPFTAIAYINVGRVLQLTGEFIESEKMLLEAVDIRKKIYGESSISYVTVIHDLAGLYSYAGRPADAMVLLEQARTILIRIGETENEYYGLVNANLGANYLVMGNLDKAVFFAHESKEIIGKTLGKESVYYAMSLYQLAEIYRQGKQFDKAEILIAEELQVWGAKQNSTSIEYGDALTGAAALYSEINQPEKAITLLSEAKTQTETVKGKDNLTYIGILEGLAKVSSNTGNHEASKLLVTEAGELERKLLLRESTTFTEKDLGSYMTLVGHSSDIMFSILKTAPDEHQSLAGAALDNLLFYKGFLLQGVHQLRQAISLSNDSTRQIHNRWKALHRQLSEQYALPLSEQQNIVDLENKANDLERELVRRVAGFGRARQTVGWQDVQRTLKPGEAAIEFVHYTNALNDKTDSVFYAALILRQGDTRPQFVPLFEESALIPILRGAAGGSNFLKINGLYSQNKRTDTAGRGAQPVGTRQESLYELAWEPVEKHLSGIQTIYFAPSGLYNRLNLYAIPLDLDSVLGDRYILVELGCTRQLVNPVSSEFSTNDALLFGGIKYDSDSTFIASANTTFNPVTMAGRGALSFANTDSTLRQGTWSALPYTDREVSDAARLLHSGGIRAEILRDNSASEIAFKSAGDGSKPSPRILHVATHGYFFPDPGFLKNASNISHEPVFKLSEHPLIRSGLIFAGGNYAWVTGKPIKEGIEDGILTAYEISQLNLSNTELVVLSACESGLGDIQGNEGVYGLQRAFKIAGVKYLIMSLWQVPDKQTSMLMTTFYKKWLEGKTTISDAFRATQKELREAGLDPYYWAGFVLIE